MLGDETVPSGCDKGPLQGSSLSFVVIFDPLTMTPSLTVSFELRLVIAKISKCVTK